MLKYTSNKYLIQIVTNTDIDFSKFDSVAVGIDWDIRNCCFVMLGVNKPKEAVYSGGNYTLLSIITEDNRDLFLIRISGFLRANFKLVNPDIYCRNVEEYESLLQRTFRVLLVGNYYNVKATDFNLINAGRVAKDVLTGFVNTRDGKKVERFSAYLDHVTEDDKLLLESDVRQLGDDLLRPTALCNAFLLALIPSELAINEKWINPVMQNVFQSF